jgi:hypothetical protein
VEEIAPLGDDALAGPQTRAQHHVAPLVPLDLDLAPRHPRPAPLAGRHDPHEGPVVAIDESVRGQAQRARGPAAVEAHRHRRARHQLGRPARRPGRHLDLVEPVVAGRRRDQQQLGLEGPVALAHRDRARGPHPRQVGRAHRGAHHEARRLVDDQYRAARRRELPRLDRTLPDRARDRRGEAPARDRPRRERQIGLGRQQLDLRPLGQRRRQRPALGERRDDPELTSGVRPALLGREQRRRAPVVRQQREHLPLAHPLAPPDAHARDHPRRLERERQARGRGHRAPQHQGPDRRRLEHLGRHLGRRRWVRARRRLATSQQRRHRHKGKPQSQRPLFFTTRASHSKKSPPPRSASDARKQPAPRK